MLPRYAITKHPVPSLSTLPPYTITKHPVPSLRARCHFQEATSEVSEKQLKRERDAQRVAAAAEQERAQESGQKAAERTAEKKNKAQAEVVAKAKAKAAKEAEVVVYSENSVLSTSVLSSLYSILCTLPPPLVTVLWHCTLDSLYSRHCALALYSRLCVLSSLCPDTALSHCRRRKSRAKRSQIRKRRRFE